MKSWKKFFGLALLLSLLMAAGCGRGPDAAGGTIGGGASAGTSPGAPEAEAGEKKLADFVLIPLWITSIQDDRTELELLVGHHLAEVKTVDISYQDVLLDGVAVESWEVRRTEGTDALFATEPEMGFSQIFTLGVNIEAYSELTIHATASYDDGTEPYPFSATFRISELERRLKK